MGVAYRLRQGFGRLRAWVAPSRIDTTGARAVLSAELWPLFAAMPPGDRWHGLCVLARLHEAGYDEPALLAAALLHDLGKAQSGLTLAHRTLIVLDRALHAGWTERLAGDGQGWRRPFFVHLHHAELGARKLRGAGADEELVLLVKRHEAMGEPLQPEMERLRQALIAADDVS